MPTQLSTSTSITFLPRSMEPLAFPQSLLLPVASSSRENTESNKGLWAGLSSVRTSIGRGHECVRRPRPPVDVRHMACHPPLYPAVGSGRLGEVRRPAVRIPAVGRSGQPTVGMAVCQSRPPSVIVVCRGMAGHVQWRRRFSRKTSKVITLVMGMDSSYALCNDDTLEFIQHAFWECPHNRMA
jgi:hypothetical protein